MLSVSFEIVSDPRCDASEEFRKDQNNPLDLHELLTEIQSLRVQLERTIETNKSLHEKLEEQLSKEKREEVGSVSAVNINYLFKQESQHYAGVNGTVPYMLLLYCRTCALFFKGALKALYSISCTFGSCLSAFQLPFLLELLVHGEVKCILHCLTASNCHFLFIQEKHLQTVSGMKRCLH